jgi:hypothetical protein
LLVVGIQRRVWGPRNIGIDIGRIPKDLKEKCKYMHIYNYFLSFQESYKSPSPVDRHKKSVIDRKTNTPRGPGGEIIQSSGLRYGNFSPVESVDFKHTHAH